MSKKLKVGVIGVGGIAKTHFPGWLQSPHVELAALSDIREDVLNKVADELKVPKRYTKTEDLIADKDLDIVDVCTPNMYHAPLSIAALEAGKHVICEKPLAPTPGEIRKMIAARDKAKKLLMTAQHFRFDGRSQALKAELDRGVLGEVYHARSWMLRRAGAPTTPGFVLKKHAGGGPCIDIGVHILDLTLWMMGNPKPVAVSGITQDRLRKRKGAFSNWGGPIGPEWDVEEFASAFVRLANGATLVLEVSWLLNHDTQGEDMQMWLYGDEGGSHWPSNTLYKTCNESQQHMNISLKRNPHNTEPHALECVKFAEAVATGAPSPVPAEHSLDVIAILDGLYRSSAENREVKLEY
ncbi:MAG: Gfo/Idh/MocA family oxidoreductase [Planctomycetes bacterium]|nr:Gfo/Idh/MocA family oxidoreductase [Planctomycetota bacterium]